MRQFRHIFLEVTEKPILRYLLIELRAKEKRYFLRNEDSAEAFGDYCYQSQETLLLLHASSLGKLITTHDSARSENGWFLVRSVAESRSLAQGRPV